jgi:CPA2 family monovalent cation:H+ antiporter-2
VVPEAIEGSLMLASHALALVGVPMRRVIRIVQDQRDARYNLLRGFFRGADDNSVDELAHERLTSVTVPDNSKAIGRTLGHYALSTVEVRTMNIRHVDGKSAPVSDDLVLAAGDTLVLSGNAQNLALAEHKLLSS